MTYRHHDGVDGTDEHFAVPVPAGYRIGRWEVREPLASGAFGSVYAARAIRPDHNALDDNTPDNTRTRIRTGAGTGTDAGTGAGLGDITEAALKFLPTGTRTPRQLRHLQDLARRELEVHRKLQRPRLIRMYEALTVDDPAQPALDGATVLVLERAEGSLDALLRRSPAGPLAAGPALLTQVCEGLAQIHRAGWVHGDLKPANVLLMPDGSVRLGDFNLAAEMDGTHAYAPVFATPDYTPPELLWSEISEQGRQIRPTADIWAFGVLAHLLLTGALPLPGGTPAARREALLRVARGQDELRLSPELPESWREIVTDCLAPTHAARSVHDTASLLRRVEEAAGTGPSPRLPRLRPRRIRRRRTWAAGAAATVLLVAGGTALALHDAPPDPAEYGAEELRTDRNIPVAYRKPIVDAAHRCESRDVSPALIAAMLKTESDFDPDLSDPVKNEYGIARWTPSVLYYWLPEAQRPAGGVKAVQPPFPPNVSIKAMGRYLCEISRSLARDLKGDRKVLAAAAYRTSVKTVNLAGGVRAKERRYADQVAHWLKAYTPKVS
ncbi:serine/threonine-protein kinase [Streptomyces sp. NBRC 110611]|uniref:serine/threonine protein kinase n=1 Tax=Streptomyces sp. NBRC 110611 TaxID=1621259 RepID=UPI00082AE4EB|nr:protein kinase [Streptomyces sp. NBRC 110611]GAU64978.1 serine/threonine-protein kinase [Streptomyces sp. NBRC 110611]